MLDYFFIVQYNYNVIRKEKETQKKYFKKIKKNA